MNNFNFDENAINKFKNILNNGDFSNITSQITPEMLENFSSLMHNNSNNSSDTQISNNFTNSAKSTSSNDFDFSNVDINTIMKMKSIMDKMNSKNNPGMNLLNSLKPYLRNGKKEKLDQYANLMNFVQIAELFKTDNKEKNNNE